MEPCRYGSTSVWRQIRSEIIRKVSKPDPLENQAVTELMIIQTSLSQIRKVSSKRRRGGKLKEVDCGKDLALIQSGTEYGVVGLSKTSIN